MDAELPLQNVSYDGLSGTYFKQYAIRVLVETSSGKKEVSYYITENDYQRLQVALMNIMMDKIDLLESLVSMQRASNMINEIY